MEAVHADWKEYLNLLICEENHLKHMDEYHKVIQRTDSHTHTTIYKNIDLTVRGSICAQYHKEARDTQDLLKRLDAEVNQKYNPDFKDVYQTEGLIRELEVSIHLTVHYNYAGYRKVC